MKRVFSKRPTNWRENWQLLITMRRMIPAGMFRPSRRVVTQLKDSDNTGELLTRIFGGAHVFFIGRKMAIRVTRDRNESRDPPDDPHVTSGREFRVRHILCLFEIEEKMNGSSGQRWRCCVTRNFRRQVPSTDRSSPPGGTCE